MDRNRGIGKCGLACALCTKEGCGGCAAENCLGVSWCTNRKCALEKAIDGCYTCPNDCGDGVHGNLKAKAFSEFIRKFGEGTLIDCLERNERAGVVYHRRGITGDYDDFETVEQVIDFILNGFAAKNISH